jgi:hypothetical protein
MKKQCYLLFLVLGVGSCGSKHTYDADIVAQDYCHCMQRRNPTHDTIEYWYAKKICDGLMTEKYSFFRLMEVDRRFHAAQWSKGLIDSVASFEQSFESHLRVNCCERVQTCKAGARRPSCPALGL